MCRLPYLDGASALLSLLGFLVSLAYVQNTDVLVWDQHLVFSAAPNVTSASDGLASALLETCGAPYAVFRPAAGRAGRSMAGTSFAVDAGRSYNPWVMLHWILAVSCVFQGARFFAHVEHEDVDAGVLFQYDPDSGPDFGRWVEYALTSPLQVVLLADLFYLRETALLAATAGLQGALVLLGYAIELEVQTLVAEKLRAWEAAAYGPPAKRTVRAFACQCKLCFLLLSAYACHATVWAVLLAKFRMQAQAARDCQRAQALRPEVATVVWLQFALFTLFGAVLTAQAVRVAGARVLDPGQAQDIWRSVAWWYSLLSIAAKLVLEWGFIALLGAADAE